MGILSVDVNEYLPIFDFHNSLSSEKITLFDHMCIQLIIVCCQLPIVDIYSILKMKHARFFQ